MSLGVDSWLWWSIVILISNPFSVNYLILGAETTVLTGRRSIRVRGSRSNIACSRSTIGYKLHLGMMDMPGMD
jgi:hypothetical protein